MKLGFPLAYPLGGADPVAVTTPTAGDEEFRDHILEMLARLPEQFKEKRT